MNSYKQISIETNENEINKKIENNNIIKKKEYNLEMNNNQYILNITIDNKFINFELTQTNDILFFDYKTKFNLNGIIKKLEISHKLYNDLEKVMDLIDNCYSNNKLILNLNTHDKINIFIIYSYIQNKFIIIYF